MMKKILNFSIIAILSSVSLTAMAQDNSSPSPIFVQKYKQPTTTSNIPTIVPATPSTQSNAVSQNNTSSSYRQGNNSSPGSTYTPSKMTSEVDYYDVETGERFNQYNYMALLAKRGDMEKLKAVGNYLQLNGVFDRQKYQTAVNRAAKGYAIPTLVDEAVAKNKLAAAQTAGQIENPTVNTMQQPQITPQSRFVVKEEEDYRPKRLHQAYDKDMEDQPTQNKPKPETNQPIFLR